MIKQAFDGRHAASGITMPSAQDDLAQRDTADWHVYAARGQTLQQRHMLRTIHDFPSPVRRGRHDAAHIGVRLFRRPLAEHVQPDVLQGGFRQRRQALAPRLTAHDACASGAGSPHHQRVRAGRTPPRQLGRREQERTAAAEEPKPAAGHPAPVRERQEYQPRMRR